VHPLRDLRQKISQYGWAIRCVQDADPRRCIAYTVGLTEHDHPEVVMTGLPADVAKAFLGIVGEVVVREGGRFKSGTSTVELADGPALPVIDVVEDSDLTAVADLYGDVTAVQIIWTDSRGRLPWEVGYANGSGSQPLLGPRPAGPDLAPNG
jgi:hypothetical protein